MLVAVAAMGSCAIAMSSCDGQKWTEEQKGSYNLVIQQGGQTLGYSPTSGVQLITDKGYAFKDLNRNGVLEPGEIGRITFEVRNRTANTLYDVRPDVAEITGNRHIFVSPAARVEQIGPGKGIRYTAMIKGDSRLKNGEAVFRIQAQQGSGRTASAVQEINVRTQR